MKYDVFISYSRKDSIIADKVCAALDEANISYFIDKKGIGGGFEFPKLLAEGIVNSQLFLLLASENAYESKFTRNEVIFAFNKKPKNSILPYIIDNSELPLDLEFTFAGTNWRNITEHPIKPTLVNDILNLLGRRAIKESLTIQTENRTTNTHLNQLRNNVLDMIYQNAIYKEKKYTNEKQKYKVGDIYNENGKEGLVFWVDETGEHGKIVSLDELKEGTFPHFGIFNGINIHSISRFDGQSNTDILNQLKISKDVKPFVWCRGKGLDWYIPAIEELRMLLSCQKCFSQNYKLQKMGKPTITKRGHWMSSSVIRIGVWGKCLHCIDHKLQDVNFSNQIRVRAISKF